MSTQDTVPHPPASPGPAGPHDPTQHNPNAYDPVPATDVDSDISPRNSMLDPPNPHFSQSFYGGPGFGPGSQTPRDSVATSNPQSIRGDGGSRNGSNAALAIGAVGGAGVGTAAAEGYDHNEFSEKGRFYPDPSRGSGGKRKKLLIFGGLIAFVIIAAAIAIPVGVVVSKNNKNNKTSSGTGSTANPTATNNPDGTNDPPKNKNPTTGGDGSTVTTEDGSTFTYSNKFGGIWVSDPEDPFNNNAQPNSWTPPLNTSWTWGKNKVNGCV